MKILDRYLSKTIFKSQALVLLTLLAIFTLIAFVEELEHVDDPMIYGVPDAIRYVAYTIPQRLLDLSPVIALLGSLIGIALLVKNSELIAIRAAAFSVRRLLLSVTIPATVLVVGLTLLGELVAAPLHQYAEKQRAILRSDKVYLLEGKGLWSNDGQRYFNVRELQHGRIPSGIYIYEFDKAGKLLTYIHANSAEIHNDREWKLIDVEYKTLENGTLVSRHAGELDIGPFWSSNELLVLPLPASSMSLTDLYHYIDYKKSTNQRTDRLELTFWQRISLPLAAAAMMLLAVPVGAGTGALRNAGFGQRITAGAIIGIVFYLGSQLIHTLGLLGNLNAALIALSPVVLVFLATAFLLWRMQACAT